MIENEARRISEEMWTSIKEGFFNDSWCDRWSLKDIAASFCDDDADEEEKSAIAEMVISYLEELGWKTNG